MTVGDRYLHVHPEHAQRVKPQDFEGIGKRIAEHLNSSKSALLASPSSAPGDGGADSIEDSGVPSVAGEEHTANSTQPSKLRSEYKGDTRTGRHRTKGHSDGTAAALASDSDEADVDLAKHCMAGKR